MNPKRKGDGAGEVSSPKKRCTTDNTFVAEDGYVYDSDEYITNFKVDGTVRAESEARRIWNFVCDFPDCGRRFNRPCRLEEHRRSHSNIRPWICDQDGCCKSFPRKDHLQRHIESAHGEPERKFACDWDGCGKTFTTNPRLRRHKEVHASKFYCVGYPPCRAVFKKQKTLDEHVKKIHLEMKPYPCTFVDPKTNEKCTLAYQTDFALLRHVMKIHGGGEEERHFCMLCSMPGTEFETVVNNLGETVKIPVEPLFFSSSAELKAHALEAHPPECSVCKQPMKDYFSLKTHMRTVHADAGDQPQYPCPRPGCKSVFNRKSNLNHHIQGVHENQCKFFCTENAVRGSKHAELKAWDGKDACGAGFKGKSTLDQHIRTTHLGLQNRKATRQMARIRKSQKKPDPSTLNLLTGVGQFGDRNIHCLVQSCGQRYFLDRDLRHHLRSAHDWSDEEIEDGIRDRDAISGGPFWVGGLDEEQSAFDSVEASVPQTPMPNFADQRTAMLEYTTPLKHPYYGMLDTSLGDMDLDDAALDAEMGLSDIPAAVDVHEGLQGDDFMASMQQFLEAQQS